MKELNLLSYGIFLAPANSEKKLCNGCSKNENGKDEKIFPLPPGGGGTVAGNGNYNCRRRGNILDAGHADPEIVTEPFELIDFP
jgi:hypothetical protein